MELCLKPLQSRSRYADIAQKLCHKEREHEGPCAEFPYLRHLQATHPRVAAKIQRDATKTTGAAWKSEDAGPNRIDRWVMLQNDETLARYGLNMQALRPTVVAKLREKAASYEDCMGVAAKLTWWVYQMPDAPPDLPNDVRDYLEKRYGQMALSSTTCIICRSPISFQLFESATRGRANTETAHSNPRTHNENNVGFAHRECNIAQGNKTLDEFYDWIEEIIIRARGGKS